MKYQQILKWLLPIIVLLAGFSAAMGLFYDTPASQSALPIIGAKPP